MKLTRKRTGISLAMFFNLEYVPTFQCTGTCMTGKSNFRKKSSSHVLLTYTISRPTSCTFEEKFDLS